MSAQGDVPPGAAGDAGVDEPENRQDAQERTSGVGHDVPPFRALQVSHFFM